MIVPPTPDQLRAMSTAPCRCWINHINPPAEPVPQETTMDKTCQTAGVAGLTANSACSAEAQESPMLRAISELRSEIGECGYNADELIRELGPALRAESPEKGNAQQRPAGASELVEAIQQAAELVRTIRVRISDARERLTL